MNEVRSVPNNLWVVGVLCVMVLITLSVRWLGSTDHPEFPVPPLAAQAVPVSPSESFPPSVAVTPTIQKQPKPFDWSSVPARDPFQPPPAVSGMTQDRPDDEEPEERVDFHLQAVLRQGSTRVAMIDRQLVKEGETIAGYLVASIQEEGVLLQGPHGRRWVRFRES